MPVTYLKRNWQTSLQKTTEGSCHDLSALCCLPTIAALGETHSLGNVMNRHPFTLESGERVKPMSFVVTVILTSDP